MSEVQIESITPYTFLSDKYTTLLEDLFEKVKKGRYRPKVHIAPPSGLLNDPNGLCYFNDKYHVFYQWYPFGARHDMKHWNHVSGDDLVSFEEEKEILIPNMEYEKNGCYSGNAYVDEGAGKCYLYYTANYKDENGIKFPMQALAIMDADGTITKFKNSPIIEGSPEGIGHNIRDPFVFKRKDHYYMLLGSETIEGKGALLLYESDNLTDWAYRGKVKVYLNGEKLNLGTFVECPGIIEIDSTEILFLSLIGSEIEGTVLENRFTTIALIGKLDAKELKFEAWSMELPDYGFDYYAPQPFYGKDGEALVYAWFGCGDQELPEDKYGWRHALTLPRQIKIINNHLVTPVHPDVIPSFKSIELNVQDPEIFKSTSEPVRLIWKLKNDQKKHTLKIGSYDNYWALNIDLENQEASVDRSRLKIKVDQDYGMVRKAPIKAEDTITIEVFLDNSFNEIYLNGGEQIFSIRSYQ